MVLSKSEPISCCRRLARIHIEEISDRIRNELSLKQRYKFMGDCSGLCIYNTKVKTISGWPTRKVDRNEFCSDRY